MYRIDNATATVTLPPPTAIGTEGYFSGGNPSTATAATIVDAEWLNMLQEEGANLVISAGLALNKADRTQWAQAIDAKLAAGPYVLKAGDRMTGNLTIDLAAGWPSLIFSRAPGTGAQIQAQSNGLMRWGVVLADSSAEGGGNSGSDFTISRYDDVGNFLNAPLWIARSDGSTNFAGIIRGVQGFNITGSGVVVGDLSATVGLYAASANITGDVYSGGSFTGAGGLILNATLLQTEPDSFWAYDPVSGDNYWSSNFGVRWTMRVVDNFNFNTWGPLGGAGPYVDSSDARGKEAITPATQGLAEVLQLNPVTFKRIRHILPAGADKPVSTAPVRTELGFVAQEVQEVLPEAVYTAGIVLPDGSGALDSDTPSLGLMIDPIVAALVNAMKTVDARLTAGGL